MNRKQIILEYRTSGCIKGHRPAIVYMKKNIGKIYLEGQADFILSIGKEHLYFQKLTLFLKKLQPSHDLKIAILDIASYNLRTYNLVTNCLTLYTMDRRFLEIYYNTKTADTYASEQNILKIIELLKEQGKMEVKI
ncbi:MAG: hypothetical protein K2I42_05180 [Anaeroplasmataceae bacterium]|nr:hypothetical protein [Anaeroplasmataceae bacterium]